MQLWCLSNGSYSLNNCHNPFGNGFQPPRPYGKIPVEHLKSLRGASLTHSYTLLKNATIQHSERLVTLETCDESDEKTWPDQQKDNDRHKDKDKDKNNDNDIKEQPLRVIIETFDLWDNWSEWLEDMSW